jgi:hypothetical protein
MEAIMKTPPRLAPLVELFNLFAEAGKAIWYKIVAVNELVACDALELGARGARMEFHLLIFAPSPAETKQRLIC